MSTIIKYIIIILIVLLIGCSTSIDRDTSRNTVIYETFDDGNCGELGFCPIPQEYNERGNDNATHNK